MDNNLTQIQEIVYNPIGLKISNFSVESESQEYHASRFELNGRNIISRTAKITPKKIGQFVTCWKRIGNGPITPFQETDPIDFYVVQVRTQHNYGQFVFPKSVLIAKGIISTNNKEGKRAFRVYPPWDIVNSKQAVRTQKWQLDYFYEIHDSIDFNRVVELYTL